jgi:hypothetical protein
MSSSLVLGSLIGERFGEGRSNGAKPTIQSSVTLMQSNAGSRLSQAEGLHDYNNFRSLTAMTNKNKLSQEVQDFRPTVG